MTRQHPQEYSPCGRVIGGFRGRPATDHSSKKSRLTLRSISLHELGWTANSPCMIRSQRSVDGEASSTSRLHVRGLGVRKLKPTSLGGHRCYSSLRRWRTQPSLSAARNISAAIAALVITILPAQGADLSTEYLKPSACMEVAGLVAAKTTSLGNDGACMQCDPANKVCPPGCQALMDNLYSDCDGVTTPDGLYFDPDNAIEGEWSDKVKAQIKIATERCGCDAANRLAPLRRMAGFGVPLSSVGLVLMTSFVTWSTAFFLLRPSYDHP
ncbi:unnamed protein product [Ectocarpus sp. 8 AP-2014]